MPIFSCRVLSNMHDALEDTDDALVIYPAKVLSLPLVFVSINHHEVPSALGQVPFISLYSAKCSICFYLPISSHTFHTSTTTFQAYNQVHKTPQHDGSKCAVL